MEKIWLFLDRPDETLLSRLFHGFWTAVIVLSVCSAIAYELERAENGRPALRLIDLLCLILFTLEFLIKLTVAGTHRMPFLRSTYTALDLIVLVQGYVNRFWQTENDVLQLLKTQAPILRLLKIARTSPKWRLLVITVRRCAEPLIIPMYMMVLMVAFSGSLLHWVENVAPGCGTLQRGESCEASEIYPGFTSIPHAMWFVLVTITTIGYGDIFPRSDGGKIVASFLMVAGICLMAMPLAIVGAQTCDVWKDRVVLLVIDKLKTNMGGRLDMVKIRSMFDDYTSRQEADLCPVESVSELTYTQFEQMICSLDIGLDYNDIQEIFSAIDKDSSGKISKDEFFEFVTSRR